MTLLDILATLTLYCFAPFLLFVGVRWILRGRKRGKVREEEVKRAAARERRIYLERLK